MSNSSMEITVLAWLQKELLLYSELLLISPVQTITSLEYWQGKPLLCLAHHYFPNSIPNLIEQLKQDTTTITTHCYQLFHDMLDIDIPSQDKWLEYLYSIYTAIDLKRQDVTLRELHIGSNKDTIVQQSNDIESYSHSLLSTLNKLFHQLVELSLKEEESNSTSSRSSPSPRVRTTTVEEIMMVDSQQSLNQLPIKGRLTTTTTTTTTISSMEDSISSLTASMSRQEIESTLLSIESKDLIDFYTIVNSLSLTVKQHPDIAICISAIDATHAALHLQLHKGDILRTSIQFTNTAASIRNELEFIQAKMLKTTTTDIGIQDLELRVKSTGTSIDTMKEEYKNLFISDSLSEQEYQFLLDKYRLISSWVDDVRVWFVEAERIRLWIEERIKTLEDKPNLNALEEIELDYELSTVQEYNKNQHELEREVELFDKEDMTRLRAHVKALTGGNKDLSPADTTTIEITFTTLMTLDRLMHLLRRHSYELQILTLRIYWEQEYNISVSWVRSTSEEVKIFVQQKARWRPDNHELKRNDIIDTLIEFEKQSSAFDQGQFTNTVNRYQDLDDACNIELPTHLESRQVAIEEAFEELTNRIAFARQVVEQYLVVTDFLDRADKLKNEGDELRMEITLAAEQHEIVNNTIGSNDFSEKVALFQENAVRLVTGVASRVPYPEATHPTDGQGNDDANEVIRMVIGARKSALVLFGEALDQSLSAYRRALQLQKRAKQLQDEIIRLTSWVDERMRSIKKSKVDVFVGKCALDDTDLARLNKERDGQVAKMNGIKENEIKRLGENIQALQHSSSQPPTNRNTITLVSSLHEGMIDLENQLIVLDGALRVHTLCLDILGKRISWETQHAKSSSWISNMTFQMWEFVSRKAQWRADATAEVLLIDRSSAKEEFNAMQNKVEEFHTDQLELVNQTFTDLIKGFGTIIESNDSTNLSKDNQPKDNITSEHVQRRQDTLEQSYHNLCDLIEYTNQVLSQHNALTSFSVLVKTLNDKGHELISEIQDANERVMNIPNIEDRRQNFMEAVKEFGKDVVNLWMQHGSQLPYPQCPEDARATRPTTNDDEISTEVATVVYKTYTELQELVKRMTELLQSFDISIVYRTRFEQWCTNADEFNSSIENLTDQVENGHIFDLQSGIVNRDSVVVPVDAYLQQSKEYTTQLARLQSEEYEPLKSQLTELKQALTEDNEVTSVDPFVTEASLVAINTSWQALNHAVSCFTKRSTLCNHVVQWESLWNNQWSFMNSLQDQVRAWNNEKNLYLSASRCDEEGDLLSTLVLNLKKAKSSLESRLDDDFPTLRDLFKKMVTSYKDMQLSGSDMESYTTSLESKQDDLEKLVLKLQDMVSSQLLESKLLKARNEWEISVDHELKLCSEKALETESFIRESARWSNSSHQVDVESIHNSAAKQISVLSTLLSNLSNLQSNFTTVSQSLLQTEALYKKKTALESTIEKTEHQGEFVDQVLKQRSSIVSHLAKVSDLESLAESIKAQFLSTDVINGQEQQLLQDYALRVTQLSTLIDLPVRHYRDHDAACREEDIAHNTVMTDMLAARKSRLDELHSSLDSILKSKENLSRCKAAEETYMTEANAVQDWITSKSALLDSIELSTVVEDLRVAVTSVGAIQSAASNYSTSIQGLKESAAQCIALIQQQGENGDSTISARIQSTQASVDASWDQLLNYLNDKNIRLTTSLHHIEFTQSVKSFHSQCSLLKSNVVDMDLALVTEETTNQWQSDIRTLESEYIEQIRSRLSEEKIKCYDGRGVSCDVLKEMNDMLAIVLKQFDEFKTLVKERTTEANHFRFKLEYFTAADVLDSCISETRKALGNLKSCSRKRVIRGNSVQDDKITLQQVGETYASICDMFEQHQEKHDEQRSFYRFLQLNKVDDLSTVDARQTKIEQRWKQLKMDVSNDKQYVDSVSRWFDLHTKLNEMQSEALHGIFQRLNQMVLEEDDSMPTFLEQDASLLKLLESRLSACWDIASSLVDDGNFDCFKTRYENVQQDLSKAESLLVEKKGAAQKHVDFSSCQKQIHDIHNNVEKVISNTKERIDTLVIDDHTSKGIEQLFRNYSSGMATAESQQKKLLGQLTSVIRPLLSSLKSKYPSDDRHSSVKAAVDHSEEALKAASNKEQAVHDIIRRALGHSKSAENISVWIDSCNQATSQVLGDYLDESEAALKIDSLSLKLVDFENVMDSFNELSESLLQYKASKEDTDIVTQLIGIAEKNSRIIKSRWDETRDQLKSVELTVERTARSIAIARKFKVIMAMVGETRDYVTGVKLFDIDDVCSVRTQDVCTPDIAQTSSSELSDINQGDDAESDDDKTRIGGICEEEKLVEGNVIQQPLLSMLRQSEVEDIQRNLLSMEADIKPQIEQELNQLNTMINEFEDIDSTFIRQLQEVKESVTSLFQMLADKYIELEKAMDIGKYLSIADDIEILQSSLEEAVSKSASHHATLMGSSLSRTDLQAKLIELDARFKYYEKKIVQNLTSAKEQAMVVISKKGAESSMIEAHLQEMEQKWASIRKQFKTRKIELSRTIDTSMDPKDQHSRIRKSSLPTRKASSLLRDRADLSLTRQRLSPTASSTTSSSTSSSTKSGNRLNPNRSTNRYLAPPLQHQPSKSATHVKPKPGRLATIKPPLNSYVADPHNDLDIEIGRIVNETPYRVKVKMVPGEVGRYWFGNLNPKLAYCRVLKSKMVMVRVGGGWTELSQFLRDHALLEGDFIPRSRRNTNNHARMIPEEDEPKSPTIQEGFIETRRDFNTQRQQRHRSTSPNTQPPQQRSSATTTNSTNGSRSNTTSNLPTGSPSHSASTNATSGYKDGDKFIALDEHGNQHEVKMRRVPEMGRNMSSTTTGSNDYTRRRIARKKEKNNNSNSINHNTTTNNTRLVKAQVTESDINQNNNNT